MRCNELEGFSPTACDHVRNPRNYGSMNRSNGYARFAGPCGDTMEFWILVESDIVRSVTCNTSGCGSSRACSSMATCLVMGKPLDEALIIEKNDILAALGGMPMEAEHCAMLAAETLKAACVDYLKHSTDNKPAMSHPLNNVLNLYKLSDEPEKTSQSTDRPISGLTIEAEKSQTTSSKEKKK